MKTRSRIAMDAQRETAAAGKRRFSLLRPTQIAKAARAEPSEQSLLKKSRLTKEAIEELTALTDASQAYKDNFVVWCQEKGLALPPENVAGVLIRYMAECEMPRQATAKMQALEKNMSAQCQKEWREKFAGWKVEHAEVAAQQTTKQLAEQKEKLMGKVCSLAAMLHSTEGGPDQTVEKAKVLTKELLSLLLE